MPVRLTGVQVKGSVMQFGKILYRDPVGVEVSTVLVDGQVVGYAVANDAGDEPVVTGSLREAKRIARAAIRRETLEMLRRFG